MSVDLNGDDLSELEGEYDLVVAMEIIEHLENPARFLRECARLIRTNGKILLSTPNIVDANSRLLFARQGTFYHFTPDSYEATGHMAILPPWLLEILIARAGLVAKRRESLQPLPTIGPGRKGQLLTSLRDMLLPAMKAGPEASPKVVTSDVLIYVLEHKESNDGTRSA
jgi:SAM-dependent methyltransferase